jgi:hypothetical protein
MTISSVRRTGLAVALIGALVSCAQKTPGRDADSPDVVVSVDQGRITAPDTIRPGWTRFQVREDGEGHIVVIFRIATANPESDVGSFLAALDSAVATPQPGVAMGGPEIGDVGDVIVHLTPGRYVLGCVIRGPDGHRHASVGEARSFVVLPGDTDSSLAAAPQPTQTLTMIDFAFTGPERWAAGEHVIRLTNNGSQDHHFRLVRLRSGASMREWMDAEDPNAIGTPVAGVARMGPGEHAYLPVALAPGSYVAYCLVPDVKSRVPHIELGMLRLIQVE